MILIQLTEERLQQMLEDAIKGVVKEVIPKEKKFYTRQEVADKIRVSLPTIHSLVNSGKLICHKIGGRSLFDSEEIDRAIEEKRIFKYCR